MGREIDREKNFAHVMPTLRFSEETEAFRADDFFMSLELNFRRVDLLSDTDGGSGGIGSTSGSSTGCTVGCFGVTVFEEVDEAEEDEEEEDVADTVLTLA